ncbi:MAG: manganese efflux pump [Clostridia bacterium]|nr:manganese efflux pump [Clostridia bacterium]
MNWMDLMLLAVGLSMDAFAVSVCKGLSLKKVSPGQMALVGLWFGAFQMGMPLIGYFLGTTVAGSIESVDHWIVFILLGLIGGNMLREAFRGGEEDVDASLSFKKMLPLAVATSIDALAAGASMAMMGDVSVFRDTAVIGLVTFCLSALGVRAGALFGSRFEKAAKIAGGIILILLGVKILLEHLGVLSV